MTTLARQNGYFLDIIKINNEKYQIVLGKGIIKSSINKINEFVKDGAYIKVYSLSHCGTRKQIKIMEHYHNDMDDLMNSTVDYIVKHYGISYDLVSRIIND